MRVSAVPSDTDPAVFEMLVVQWRSMTIAERVGLVDQLCADVERLAMAGIAMQRPTASVSEIRQELARRRYGSELADAAYRDLPVGR